PARAAGVCDRLQGCFEVDTTVARYGIDAAHDRIEEAPALLARPFEHVRAHILGVHVVDARGPLTGYHRRIITGESEVSGIEQQAYRVRRALHQPVDLVRLLDDRAHVMMEGDTHALIRHVTRELADAFEEHRPLCFRHYRPVRYRNAPFALDRAGGLCKFIAPGPVEVGRPSSAADSSPSRKQSRRAPYLAHCAPGRSEAPGEHDTAPHLAPRHCHGRISRSSRQTAAP